MSGRYLAGRVASLCVTLLVVSVITFLVLRIIPGDPAQLILGADSPGDSLRELQHELGTDRPLPVQYVSWLGSVLRGELGVSLRHKRPVIDLIVERLPVTLSLAGLALLIAMAVGLPLGVEAARRRNTAADYAALAFSEIGQSVPSFWLGILMILAFSLQLGWLPSGGFIPWSESLWQAVRHLIMPSVALGLVLAATIVRMERSSVLEVLAEDYMRTARAKGLAERHVIYRHALANALIPTVTIVGLQVGTLLGGAIIVEQIFSLPGLGRLVLFAVFNRDWPLIQGLVFFLATLTIVLNFLVDLSYAWLDPRIGRG
jgi:peptide/nickel transport system permease protein